MENDTIATKTRQQQATEAIKKSIFRVVDVSRLYFLCVLKETNIIRLRLNKLKVKYSN